MQGAPKHPLGDLGSTDPLTAGIFQSFQSAAKLHRQVMMKRLAAEGGHPGEIACLRTLSAHDGMSQRDLAEHLHLSRPWITKMLQSMERAGLVERRSDERDQRLTRVHLTATGFAREAELRSAWEEYLHHTVGSLSERDRRELLRIMGLLSERVASLLVDEQGEGGE